MPEGSAWLVGSKNEGGTIEESLLDLEYVT